MREIVAHRGLVALAASLWLAAGAAHADPVGDANAGLQALNQGDAKTAIHLFTGAIASGALSNDDLEYAYVERGKAYLQRNEPDHARRDADQALRLKPSDQDALALWNATTIQAQPGKPGNLSDAAVIYKCQPAVNPANPNYFFEVDVDYDKRQVRNTIVEQGRTLDAEITDTSVSWKTHFEGTGKDGSRYYVDSDFSLNRASQIMTDNWVNSSGRSSSVSYACHNQS